MVAAAIQESLRDASIEEKDISYIKAHGTSTFLNDKLEYQALSQVFGQNLKNIPVSSLKSQMGHCTDASALVELVITIEMMKRQEIFPMTTTKNVDPEFQLDLVLNKKRNRNLCKVLCNSIGFGGYNASLIIADPRDD